MAISEKPNIIILISDALRPRDLSLYGYNIETDPNIKKIASESLIFCKNFSASNASDPSVNSILTGKYPANNGIIHQHPNMKDEEIEKLLEDFGDVNSYLLMPRTWQEAIITYSDLSDKNEERVDPIWKIKDAMERYRTNPQIADPVFVIAHERAINRLTNLCYKIDNAQKGKLTESEMSTFFGFL